MLAYLEVFPFGTATTRCAATDNFLNLPSADDLMSMLADVSAAVETINNDQRRVLQVIDVGFQSRQDFGHVIDGFRSSWMLYGDGNAVDT